MNLWNEVIYDLKGFPDNEREINKTIWIAREVDDKGFIEMVDEEVTKYSEEHQEVLKNWKLETCCVKEIS